MRILSPAAAAALALLTVTLPLGAQAPEATALAIVGATIIDGNTPPDARWPAPAYAAVPPPHERWFPTRSGHAAGFPSRAAPSPAAVLPVVSRSASASRRSRNVSANSMTQFFGLSGFNGGSHSVTPGRGRPHVFPYESPLSSRNRRMSRWSMFILGIRPWKPASPLSARSRNSQ